MLGKIKVKEESIKEVMRHQDLVLLGWIVNLINQSNGWDIPTKEDFTKEESKHFIPSHIALCHSELSEALEAFRKKDFENFEEEMVDVLIRVLCVLNGLGVNIDDIMQKKLIKNSTREYRHGGKKI